MARARRVPGGFGMIRVALVDDQAMVRVGFRMILETEPDITVVGEAGDGRDAIDMVRRSSPDVVLMDVRMPHMDGIEATARIVADDGGARVLMLTTFDLDDYVYAALRAGASGFLLKDAPAEQLVQAVRVIAAGDALLAPSVTRLLIDEVSRRPPVDPAAVAPGLVDLTDRELEVLRLLARGRSNGEIAQRLFLGEATVKTHVGRVLTKLGVRDRVQAVVVAYESGLVTPGTTDDSHDPIHNPTHNPTRG
jgi:DNA-binding NarL/FixJ family response regulator